MANHIFDFDGGRELATMGASWFVSYSLYYYKDKSHLNWKNNTTYQTRINVFNRTKNYHQYWLIQILEMNDSNLNKNEIDLDAKEIKNISKELIPLVEEYNTQESNNA